MDGMYYDTNRGIMMESKGGKYVPASVNDKNNIIGSDGRAGVAWDGGDGFIYTRGNDGSRIRVSSKTAHTTTDGKGTSGAYINGNLYRMIDNPAGTGGSASSGGYDAGAARAAANMANLEVIFEGTRAMLTQSTTSSLQTLML